MGIYDNMTTSSREEVNRRVFFFVRRINRERKMRAKKRCIASATDEGLNLTLLFGCFKTANRQRQSWRILS